MSKIPVLLDALVAHFQAAPELADVVVTDGPVVTGDASPDWLVVGYDGNSEGDFEAATAEQDWTSLSTTRGENISIPCALVVSRGDDDVKAARDAAFAFHDAVTSLFFNDPTIGVPQTRAAVGATRLHQVQTADGIEVRLAITVVCETLG